MMVVAQFENSPSGGIAGSISRMCVWIRHPSRTVRGRLRYSSPAPQRKSRRPAAGLPPSPRRDHVWWFRRGRKKKRHRAGPPGFGGSSARHHALKRACIALAHMGGFGARGSHSAPVAAEQGARAQRHDSASAVKRVCGAGRL